MKISIKLLSLITIILLFISLLAGCTGEKCDHTGGVATCTEAGVCSICNKEYIDAKGHKYDGKDDIDCNECGFKRMSAGLEYKLRDDGTYEVVSYGECTDTEIVIPSVYDGKAVTSIGDRAFYGLMDIVSVIIPDGILFIGDFAFLYCQGLTSLIIPDSVTYIGDSAFKNCISLESVKISNSLTVINRETFHNCESLTSVEIPNSVTTIRQNAFLKCKSLSSITIYDSMVLMEENAFKSCQKLKQITFKGTVEEWGKIKKINSLSGISSAIFVFCTDGSFVIQ